MFTTEKGTVLPLLNLRGREYLEVKYRLVWFREERPNWSIETELVSVTDHSALAKALIRDENGRIVATSHKAETVNGFPDFLEKAETGAVGRALALIGYGTQFCADELDEGARIVDSPVDRVPTPVSALSTDLSRESAAARASAAAGFGPAPVSEEAAARLRQSEDSLADADLGEFVVRFGKKYMGKRLKEIPQRDIESYVAWLKSESEKRGGAPSFEVRILEKAVQWYFHPETRPSHSAAETAPGEVEETASAEAPVRPGLRTEAPAAAGATGTHASSGPAQAAAGGASGGPAAAGRSRARKPQ